MRAQSSLGSLRSFMYSRTSCILDVWAWLRALRESSSCPTVASMTPMKEAPMTWTKMANARSGVVTGCKSPYPTAIIVAVMKYRLSKYRCPVLTSWWGLLTIPDASAESHHDGSSACRAE